MKTICNVTLCCALLLLTAPMLRAQDFSKYRKFSLDTSLATVLKQTDQKFADVKATHIRPALIQEVTWWPPNLPGVSSQSDSVQQMLFSFYNGALYKMTVIYDRTSTEGLTASDMVKSISAKYGSATNVAPAIDISANEQYGVMRQPIASWQDSQYSFNLVRSSFSGGFELVIYSNRVNSQAEVAATEAARLDEQEGPQRAADRKKKETDDLEAARSKNQKSFHP